jgi:hypothetical protein
VNLITGREELLESQYLWLGRRSSFKLSIGAMTRSRRGVGGTVIFRIERIRTRGWSPGEGGRAAKDSVQISK